MARVVSAAGERMGTVTLTEFLLARIAEDEAAIRAGGYDWIEISEYMVRERRPGAPVVFTEERALAVCEAHRRIVELHSDSAPFCDSHVDHGMTHREAYDAYPQQREWCDTLRALAAIYADRDGFREEWAAL